MSRVDAADNMNLLVVLQEFEEYYEMKFGCKPKLVRKVASADDKRMCQRRGHVIVLV